MVKKIAFLSYFIVVLVLVTATIIEKFEGTTYIQNSIYSSIWFYAIWCVMTLSAICYIFHIKLYRELSSFMLHASFVVILAGALTTALTAERGGLYLQYDIEQSGYIDNDNQKIDLPFVVKLHDFDVVYYSGTKAAADYISHIVFIDEEGEEHEATISMNKIAKYKGYRFYQTDYDNWGSYLSVSRDIYGIPITYSGYILLVLSLIWMLIAPNGAFRRLLRSPLLRRGVLMLLFTIFAGTLFASNNQAKTARTLTKSQIESLSDLQVVYNDRVMPITTLAHDFSLKLMGDREYKGNNSMQFFWGWLLFPTEWESEPIFKVPESDKQRFLELKPMSCYKDFFTDKNNYKLNHYIRNTEPKTQPALLKELRKLNEQIQLVAMLRSGAMIKIFPYRDSTGLISWYSPVDKLPDDMESGQALFIQNSIDLMLSALVSGNDENFRLITSKLISYQQKYGEESLILSQKVQIERLYYSIPITKLLYRINLLLGVVSILLLVLFSKNRVIEVWTIRTLNLSMIFVAVMLLVYIVAKWYITGRMPLVNGYDTMIFLGFCISVATLFVNRNSSLFTAMGTLLVGFTMLVATIGGMNPQITPLMPVLNSPFLTTHVALIMLSYTLFVFTFLNGIIAITAGRKNRELMQRLTIYSRIFIMLGVSLLAVGIFIGAVWANVSWGRYWAWDPKEVWALITMMLYALVLHTRSLAIFRNDKMFHIYLIIIFVSVLMTYFGVNYLLGGMHSYAG